MPDLTKAIGDFDPMRFAGDAYRQEVLAGVWLRAWCAAMTRLNCNDGRADELADACVKSYKKRWMPDAR